MSYEKPDPISEKQNTVSKTLNTTDLVRNLNCELNIIGLRINGVSYYKNEYCGDRDPPCSCPYWFRAKIEHLYTRIYEPNIWFLVCRRKRVYEIRFITDYEGSFVEDDFWIKKGYQTQVKGKYIHAYNLKEAAGYIKIAHQASEIKHYQSDNYKEYYAGILKKNG